MGGKVTSKQRRKKGEKKRCIFVWLPSFLSAFMRTRTTACNCCVTSPVVPELDYTEGRQQSCHHGYHGSALRFELITERKTTNCVQNWGQVLLLSCYLKHEFQSLNIWPGIALWIFKRLFAVLSCKPLCTLFHSRLKYVSTTFIFDLCWAYKDTLQYIFQDFLKVHCQVTGGSP